MGTRRTAGPGRAGLCPLRLLTWPVEVGGRGPVLLGVPAWPCWPCPQLGRERKHTVCPHSTALIEGVSVCSVTNSVTTPPSQDLPLPSDSHLASGCQDCPLSEPARLVFAVSPVPRRVLIISLELKRDDTNAVMGAKEPPGSMPHGPHPCHPPRRRMRTEW